ncbi:MAG: Haloacid dehalogenase domain protein hydrolase [Akkermansiaceae bacterium]|nr:Haloacid dehalogenase domain protein hydrolase [Akkermansiaceae bacterium]
MKSSGNIEIRGLKLTTFIGVPEEERASSQELRLTLIMTPWLEFRQMADEIGKTINYADVALDLQKVALSRPRQLIETLVEDLADHLLASYPLASVRLSLEKFILPDTDFVAVHLEKSVASSD